ncbi:hypothetical protein BU14_0483s0005 [Porphyra umbilicalis]|uniref:Nucleotide-diphospho-sugar transferase domain-containing protein n=1 Tax=Porphyra umbilicalis TaxID=2786 RepID=A0A1X6NTQ7_PORUM|nr:hypothetical protein BU14_0483s0005 [Porphyra umbilicalis]|eukprot:OSX71992.1 hypothetical protein BU14_0483s0005 [Porphyra umbilicalis]
MGGGTTSVVASTGGAGGPAPLAGRPDAVARRVAQRRRPLVAPLALLVLVTAALVVVLAVLARGVPVGPSEDDEELGSGADHGAAAPVPPVNGGPPVEGDDGVAVPPVPPAPRPFSRVTLLHMYNGVSFFRRLGALTGANKARYAARHGYEFVSHTPDGTVGLYNPVDCGAPPPDGGAVVRRPASETAMGCFTERADFSIDTGRRATFGKLHLARAACVSRPNGWLLWSDADAMVINQSVPVESLIDDAVDFMVTADWLMVQAGVFLVKCSEWGLALLAAAEGDRKFDRASALDQSALQAVLDGQIQLPGEAGTTPPSAHVRWLPKRVLDVYGEEYVPGDFLVHFAGKLYEATEAGLWSIARQFELLSTADEVDDVAAFFATRYLLNAFSGTCVKGLGQKRECKPSDPRRVRLGEPLSALAQSPKGRYRHVGMRYAWLAAWTDKYDVPGWDARTSPLAVGAVAAAAAASAAADGGPLDGGGGTGGTGHAGAAAGWGNVSRGHGGGGGGSGGGGGGSGAAAGGWAPDDGGGADGAAAGDVEQLQEPDDGLLDAGQSVGKGGGRGGAPAGAGDDELGGGKGVRQAAGVDGGARAKAGANADGVGGDEGAAVVGTEGGWAKWAVIGVLLVGIVVAARVLAAQRRKSPDKAL